MCGGGRTVVQATPSPSVAAATSQQKPVVYMRNSWLDGLGINAESSGRNSLRIDPGSPTPMKPIRTGGPLPPTRVGTGGIGLGIGGPNIGGIGIGNPFNPFAGIDRGHGINAFVRSAIKGAGGTAY